MPCTDGPRRSGRTWAAVEQAARLVQSTGNQVRFIVWQSSMRDMIYEYMGRMELPQWIMSRIVVVSYHSRNECGGVAVYDHYVTECLARKSGDTFYDASRDEIEVCLEVDGFRKFEIIEYQLYQQGYLRVIMREPLSYCVYENTPGTIDATTMTAKVAEFTRTSRAYQGRTIFECK